MRNGSFCFFFISLSLTRVVVCYEAYTDEMFSKVRYGERSMIQIYLIATVLVELKFDQHYIDRNLYEVRMCSVRITCFDV